MAFPGVITSQYSLDGVVQPFANYSYSDGDFDGSGSSTVLRIWSNSDPSGYVFSHWSFSGVVPAWSGSITDRTLTSVPRGQDSQSGRIYCIANFITEQPPQTYTVTTSASPIGSGTTTGDGVYQEHALCTITATPNTGYRFIKWILSTGEEPLTMSYTFSVEQDTQCTAYFVRKTGLILRNATSNIILRYNNTLLRDD